MDKDERHQELLNEATAGLRRAAKDAEKIARDTGTPLVVWRDGKVVDALADDSSRNYTPRPEAEVVVREEPDED